MAFDNVRLPDDVERGASGGPRFKNTVVTLSSGFEKRNIDWDEARGEWDIGYGISSRADLDAVVAFFYARQGRARGYRFKDWSDFEVEQSTTGYLGDGDGAETNFQARKQYVSGLVTYNRILTKLVTGTVRVFLDDVETMSFAVDVDTGIITMGAPPGMGVAVSITCEFDVPVRFDTDKLDLTMTSYQAAEVPSIPIIELRVA